MLSLESLEPPSGDGTSLQPLASQKRRGRHGIETDLILLLQTDLHGQNVLLQPRNRQELQRAALMLPDSSFNPKLSAN